MIFLKSMFCSKKKAGGSFFGLVLIGGLILAIFNLAVGLAFSIRIPLTDLSLSLGGSLGKKEMASQVLPNYLQNRMADNNSFINHTHMLTIWLAQGIGMCVFGQQPEAPAIDLHLNLKTAS